MSDVDAFKRLFSLPSYDAFNLGKLLRQSMTEEQNTPPIPIPNPNTVENQLCSRNWDDQNLSLQPPLLPDVYKKIDTQPLPMSDTETVMSQLNHILYLQNTIRLECKTIMELQSKEEDLNTYAQHQTVLNSLFVQHMELGLKATGLIAAENLKPVGDQVAIGVSISSTESVDDDVQLTARTLDDDGVCNIGRTPSCEPGVD